MNLSLFSHLTRQLLWRILWCFHLIFWRFHRMTFSNRSLLSIIWITFCSPVSNKIKNKEQIHNKTKTKRKQMKTMKWIGTKMVRQAQWDLVSKWQMHSIHFVKWWGKQESEHTQWVQKREEMNGKKYTRMSFGISITYRYRVISSMSTSIESWLMCKSSRSIKCFTNCSFKYSICVWKSLTMICSWATFMSVSICRDTRRFSGANLMPAFSTELRIIVVIGDCFCFWRSICVTRGIMRSIRVNFISFKLTSICMCAISLACANAIRASICRRACFVKKSISFGSSSVCNALKFKLFGRSENEVKFDC